MVVRATRRVRSKLGAAVVLVGVVAFWAADGHAIPAHYTDGTTFASKTNFGPPPMNPHFSADGNCTTDVIDPPTYVFITEHFVYGASSPPAGVVPVHDDASLVVPYTGGAPGTFTVNIAAEVHGKKGFRADTWNIGTGVTAWVPFNCTDPSEDTTTTTALEAAGSTTIPPTAMTSSTIDGAGSTTTPPTKVPVSSATGRLPFTGGYTGTLMFAAAAIIAAGALLTSRKSRRRG